MKAVVLLSAGRHPVSGWAMPVGVELQAVALALGLGAEVTGLYAGPDDESVRDALGHGLRRIVRLDVPADQDPLPALHAALLAMAPDLVLAGRRGVGGEESGMLPYRLARALGWPMAADAAGLDEGFTVLQALPRGARRRLVLAGPALITVHDAAPPPLPFVHMARATSEVVVQPGLPGPEWETPETAPYRRRPRVIGPAGAPAAAGVVMLNPAPEDAAAAILAALTN
jgi:electron transfer flavoprotein beta subunit